MAATPPGDWRLDERQRKLASRLRDSPELQPAYAVALHDVSDRIGDAIDSVLHVLQAQTSKP